MAERSGRKLKYWQAINKTLAAEMERDERVCAFGEDIAVGGGSFGATRGLLDKFGSSRVRDTPISELAIAAVGTGSAMTGLRPVIEIMYMDFIQLALDQIVNQAAKMRFMAGGAYSVPLTVRTLVASRTQSGPQHSQSFEAWLGGVPGLRVVWPTTPADAAALLRSSISSATLTPSLVTVGPPQDLSSTALRPRGPRVAFTARASFSTPARRA